MARNDEKINIVLATDGSGRVVAEMRNIGKTGEAAFERISVNSREASERLKSFGRQLSLIKNSTSYLALRQVAADVVHVYNAVKDSVVGALEGLDRLDKAAANANLGVERFQELSFAAEQSGISLQLFEDGMRRLTRRVGEFANSGGGPAQKAFEALGISVTDAAGNVRSTEAIFDDIVKAMSGIEDQARRTAFQAQLFGDDAGPKMDLLLRQGASGIEALTNKAREMGMVLDEHIIRQGVEAKDELEAIARVIDANLSSALSSIAPFLIRFTENLAKAAGWIRYFADTIRDLENKSRTGIQREMLDLSEKMAQLRELEARKSEELEAAQAAGYQRRVDALVHQLAVIRQHQAEVLTAYNRAADVYENRQSTAVIPGSAETDGAAGEVVDPGKVDDAEKAIRQYRDVLADLTRQYEDLFLSEREAFIAAAVDRIPDDVVTNERRREVENYAAQLYDARQEVRAIEEAEKARQKTLERGLAIATSVRTAEEEYAATMAGLNALRREGAITEEAYARAAEDAADRRLAASREAADGMKRALKDYADSATNAAANLEQFTGRAFQSMEDALVAFATTGKLSFRDMIDSMIADLARLMIRQQITGPLAEMLGGLDFGRMFGRMFGGSGGGGDGAALSHADAITWGVNHSGGFVGDPGGQSRVAPTALLAGAARFHGGGQIGLRPGEVPVIAMAGERVLTEAQQDNTAATIQGLARLAAAPRSAPGAGGVQVVVHNNAGNAEASARATPTGDGGFRIDVLVEEIEGAMSRNIMRGQGLADPLESRYGLSPSGGAYPR